MQIRFIGYTSYSMILFSDLHGPAINMGTPYYIWLNKKPDKGRICSCYIEMFPMQLVSIVLQNIMSTYMLWHQNLPFNVL